MLVVGHYSKMFCSIVGFTRGFWGPDYRLVFCAICGIILILVGYSMHVFFFVWFSSMSFNNSRLKLLFWTRINWYSSIKISRATVFYISFTSQRGFFLWSDELVPTIIKWRMIATSWYRSIWLLLQNRTDSSRSNFWS